MDGITLALLEAGVIRVMTKEEAAASTFDCILGGEGDSLSDPTERFKAAEQVLQSWSDRLPRLPTPGVSLCQRCENIDVGLLKSPSGYMHSEIYWRLAASARECPMCALIVGAMRGAYSSTGDFDTAMKLNHPLRTDLRILLRAGDGHGHGDAKDSDLDGPDEIGTIRVEMTNVMPMIPPGRLCVFALPGSPAARHGLQQQRLAPDETEKLAIMSDWMRLPPRNGPPASSATIQDYPRRLVDVGAASESLNADVRLVERSTLPLQWVEYAALSYRWGAQNSLMTTKQTLDSHQRGIPVESLPRTLRDAVTAARRLSIRYLWIDSLCIIQDDKIDWDTEAQHMDDIYMNSVVTIAAHAAEHAGHGFLEQALARPHAIPVGARRNGASYGVEAAAYAAFEHPGNDNAKKEELSEGDQPASPFDSDAFFVTESFNSNAHLDTSELASRGWAVQERILSRKTIHFCRNGSIYLETEDSLQHINQGQRGARYHHESRGLRQALSTFYNERRQQGNPTSADTIRHSTPSNPLPDPLADIRRDWYHLVARYSTCSLTKPRDKLVAISGIARKLQPILNDNYYCGIWQGHFHTNLLWLRRKDALAPPPENPPPFSPLARAPSWSWAAYDGAIQYPIWSHPRFDTFIKPELRFGLVLSRDIPPSSRDSIFDGWGMLELRGAVRIGTGLRFCAAKTGKPQWDLVVNSVTVEHESRFWGVASDAGEYIGWAALDGEGRDDVDGQVERITCFKVASFANDRPQSGFKRGFMVLFVKLVDPVLGIFGRVGMGQIMDASLFDERDPSTRHERLVLV